ncbi:MAG: alpha/beta fold hydrolase [Cyanobacteria bacterium P01_A01_bin.114]
MPYSARARGLRSVAVALGTSLVHSVLLALPGLSAERVYANYGPIGRYISVESLSIYAHTGELTEELEGYSRYLTPQQLEQLRTGLLVSADLDVVAVSQFLYTPQGEAILAGLGEVIQTAGRQNGALAIRGAVIVAAADPDGGLNVLNVLKHFPTQGVRVDLGRFAVVARAAIAEINQTRQTTAQIREQFTQSATDPVGDRSLTSQFTLASAGPVGWEKQAFTPSSLPTDLYLPEGQNLPLVVISHGLGGNRATLAYLAEHLASHGFAVVVVEHEGSNEAQLGELLSGQAREAVEPTEMVRRPTSIQALLDDLETASQQDPALLNRINFQQVGVLGQSFGAYTTLALAGATIDLDQLEESCPPRVAQLNLSLLLQCLVPSLPDPLPPLQDQRVQAAIAINPFNSAIFGPEGLANITVPTMFVSGTADTVTPALAEQIRPFSWLDAPERYLLLMEGATHFSTIFDPEAVEAVSVPERAIGPSPELAQRYVKALSLAFFKTHLAGDETYRQYLDPSYAAVLSQPDMPISLIRELTLEE